MPQVAIVLIKELVTECYLHAIPVYFLGPNALWSKCSLLPLFSHLSFSFIPVFIAGKFFAMMDLLFNASIPSALTSIFLFGCVYYVVQAVYRLYFSPIAHFPGSKLAAVSLW